MFNYKNFTLKKYRKTQYDHVELAHEITLNSNSDNVRISLHAFIHYTLSAFSELPRLAINKINYRFR